MNYPKEYLAACLMTSSSDSDDLVDQVERTHTAGLVVQLDATDGNSTSVVVVSDSKGQVEVPVCESLAKRLLGKELQPRKPSGA